MSFIDFVKQFDYSVLVYIYENLRCSFLDVLMPFLSVIGEGGIVWVAIAIVMIIFKKTRLCGIMMISSMLISFLIGEIALKNIFGRLRPFHDETYNYIKMLVDKPLSYSFPSGHTSSSFASALSIFLYNKRAGIAAIILAFLIGFSRLYNFVHFPSDVLCGALLGILCALITYFIFKKFIISDDLV